MVNGPGVVARLRLTFWEREILCYGGIVGNVSKGASGGLWVTAQPLWQAERAGQRATQLTGCETSVLKTVVVVYGECLVWLDGQAREEELVEK